MTNQRYIVATLLVAIAALVSTAALGVFWWSDHQELQRLRGPESQGALVQRSAESIASLADRLDTVEDVQTSIEDVEARLTERLEPVEECINAFFNQFYTCVAERSLLP